jgi:hypothetical protein
MFYNNFIYYYFKINWKKIFISKVFQWNGHRLRRKSSDCISVSNNCKYYIFKTKCPSTRNGNIIVLMVNKMFYTPENKHYWTKNVIVHVNQENFLKNPSPLKMNLKMSTLCSEEISYLSFKCRVVEIDCR